VDLPGAASGRRIGAVTAARRRAAHRAGRPRVTQHPGDRPPAATTRVHRVGPGVAFAVAADRRHRDEQDYVGVMHVKAAVADSRVAFLTSANLTEAAPERNMELGVFIRGGRLPAAIDRLIDALVESGELQTL
jgi:phosphatidylserine/phosphatidylglycerophosphate/cardiolipin synthase-like enzyme